MDLVCEYKLDSWPGFPNKLYTCVISSASITNIDDRTIQSITGIHLKGRSDKDVEEVWFNRTVLNYFPKGLHQIFPKLIFIWIYHCGLKAITRDDLSELKNLELIYLGNNKLTTLPSDLFEDMSKLKRISFTNNKLEFVSSQLFVPIMNNGLTYADFRENKNIDAFFGPGYPGSVAKIETLMNIIDAKCRAPEEEEEEEERTSDDEKDESYHHDKTWIAFSKIKSMFFDL